MGAESGKIAMTNRLLVVACGQVYTLCVSYLLVASHGIPNRCTRTMPRRYGAKLHVNTFGGFKNLGVQNVLYNQQI